MAQKPKCGSHFECENKEKHPEAFFVYHCGNCMACIKIQNPSAYTKKISLSQQVAENPSSLIDKMDNQCRPEKPCYGKSGATLCNRNHPCELPFFEK